MGPASNAPARRGATFVVALALAVAAFGASAPTAAELEERSARAGAREKTGILLQLANELEATDIARAMDVATRAQAAAETPGDRLDAQAEIAALQRLRGEYAVALSMGREGLAECERLGDDSRRAKFLYIVARTYWSLADYPASTAAFLDCIKLAQQTGNRALECDAQLGISMIYNELRQPEQAREHIEAARVIAESLNDPQRLGDYYKIHGNALLGQNDLAGARAAHEKSRQIFERAGNDRGVADALQNLAALAEGTHDLATAVTNCERAIAIYQRLGLKRHLLNAERELGRVMVRQGRAGDALPHLQTSLKLAQELGGRIGVANAYRELSIAYEAKGDFRAALTAQRDLQTEMNAILDEKARQQMSVLNARYDAERRQHEIDVLRRDTRLKENELERAQWQRYGIAGGLGLGMLLLGAVISRQRLKLRAERRVLEEARTARAAAEEADRVKTRFLGIASHDIRGPLGNIVNLTNELRSSAANDEIHLERCDLIGAEAQRVICLVEDLITTAALESGRLDIRRSNVDLNNLVGAVVTSLRWQADAKRQALKFAPASPGSGAIQGDAARLHQVVSNLVSNAIKFSPPGKSVELALARRDGQVVLSVRDHGPGIAAKDIDRLFVPFERLATHPTAHESSHGLGLSIAQQIVQLHGGRIRVESKPGDGSTFLVELPTEEGAAGVV